MVDPDQLASDKVSYRNLDPQSHCLPMITLVNVNAPEVTTTNWCWLNSALEHTRKKYLYRSNSRTVSDLAAKP